MTRLEKGSVLGLAAALLAMATMVAVGSAGLVLAARTCDYTGGGDQAPPSDDCCENLDPGLTCDQVSPGLENGRKNVLLVVVDDQGHCTNGFMGGRCAKTEPGERCRGPRCSNAPWLECDTVADCPAESCGAPPPTCTAPAGECPCRDGFCVQSASGCGEGEVFVDGLCSPRASCAAGGDFVCARGVCDPDDPNDPGSGRHCRGTGASCTSDADCDDSCQLGTCIDPPEGHCEMDGVDTAIPCASASDCELCRATPAPCDTNGECGDGYSCTESEFPLRLNDISCRYRNRSAGDDDRWAHTFAQESVLRKVVYTPTIDRLAAEGFVFPRGRAGAQVCSPARKALLMGRVHQHRTKTGEGKATQCAMRLDQSFDEPVGCRADGSGDADCGRWLYEARCDLEPHSIPWWMGGGEGVPPDAMAATQSAWAINVGKHVSFNRSQFDEESTGAGSGTLSEGKFPCPVLGCGEAFEGGKTPWVAVDAQHELIGLIRNLVDDDGLSIANPGPDDPHLPFFVYYGPELPHDASKDCANTQEFFNTLYGSPVCNSNSESGNAQLSAMSYFDASLGAAIDELKRTCVCGPDPDPLNETGAKPTSVWDQTVVILLPDHGILLPNSKGGDGSENAHRFAAIVRIPGEARPRVLGEAQSMGFYDVLPTVLDYVNGFTGTPSRGDALDRYPVNSSLRPLLDGHDHRPFLRNIYYGAESDAGGSPGKPNLGHYLVTRPGFFGSCDGGTDGVCRSDIDCDDGTCSTSGGMCVGTRLFCNDDGDCGTCRENGNLSDPPVPACTTASGRCCSGSPYPDFDESTDCSDDADCVPPNACRPPIVKVVKKSGIVRVFELNSNPDEERGGAEPLEQDLASTSFVPSPILDALGSCIDEFRIHIDGPDGTSDDLWAPGRNPTPPSPACPPAWRAWPWCTTQGCAP